MIGRRLDELPGTRLVRGDGAQRVHAVEIDSRAVRPGALFVAIRGGLAHVGDALRGGAVAALVDEGRLGELPADVGPLVAAPDVIAALQALGAANRDAASGTIVLGVTGSSGKTSTKDVIAGLVAGERRTIAAAEGHNNEIGLPLTLTRIAVDTEVAVCELSMRGPGQVAELARLARPSVGVITNVGTAHIGLLGSRAAIAAAKAELLAALPPGGACVVPADEPLLAPFLRDDLVTITFGEGEGATVAILGRTPRADGQDVRLRIAGAERSVATSLRGPHGALNLAAGLAAVLALGLDVERAAARAGTLALQRWRDEEHPLPGGGAAINDAYNANPASVRVALAHAVEQRRPGGRVVLVLGPMAELGDDGHAFHRELGALAGSLGIDVLVAIGEAARGYLEGAADVPDHRFLPDAADAVALLADLVAPGDVVLVKGSRSAALEGVAAGLSARLANGDGA